MSRKKISVVLVDDEVRALNRMKILLSNFSQVDILLTPTTPTTAFKLGEKLGDSLQMYLSDIYTVSANLAGIPGMNIPIGKSANGLPIGMQILSNSFEEEKIFQLGMFMQNEITE